MVGARRRGRSFDVCSPAAVTGLVWARDGEKTDQKLHQCRLQSYRREAGWRAVVVRESRSGVCAGDGRRAVIERSLEVNTAIQALVFAWEPWAHTRTQFDTRLSRPPQAIAPRSSLLDRARTAPRPVQLLCRHCSPQRPAGCLGQQQLAAITYSSSSEFRARRV
jgi:hypothetical protein